MTALPGERLAVLGAGSWGTALAVLLARNGYAVRLWGHHPEHIALLRAERRNPRHLPGVDFPPALEPLADLETALAGVRDVLVVVPSHVFRSVLERIRALRTASLRLAWATKGIERGSAKLLHEVAAETLGATTPTAALSGPTFAREVAQGLPTAITVASNWTDLAADFAARLHNARFRAYTSTDIVGVQLGGAVKNVLAIAAGISDGLGFGANSRAALITRGLVEIVRLGVALGGRRETFDGLAGLGDLVLTCTDDQSRNRRLGLAVGRGRTVDDARREIGQAVEGIYTAEEVVDLARRHAVEMPITEQTHRVLHAGVAPKVAVETLFAREQKPETLR
jgi:glycerol-3-phosphate dehydrogenase (NAD(P)+)